VPGDWKLVWHDEFNGKELSDEWEIYTANYWDKRTHFTKDNAFLRGGNAVLKYEKKTGHQNDDPSAKTTDYACGFLSTYGRKTWTYGYFEARMKLPTAPGLWPAFWTMPDRGADKGPQWVRADTWKGGMEFDVMEHLTAWGPHRFNIACHWDGYGKDHKSVGTSGAYLPADKDGYIVVGFLWLPGQYVVYGNGVEIGRLESSRICNVPSYVILYMVSGGWANVALEDEKLPDEFQIDWIRVWQRKDMVK
jgi:beta-glucanase (GH16 family)